MDFETLVPSLGGGSGGSSYQEVATAANLPPYASSVGQVFLVQQASGIWPFRKPAGLYKADASQWNWLGNYAWVAEEIAYTAGGGIEATTVAAAIAELGVERATPAEVAGAVSAHEALSDPHPGYLKQAEADTLYAPIGGGGGGDPAWTYVELASNALNSTITIAATALAFTPEPNSFYEIEIRLFMQSAAATTGARPGVKFPTAGVTQSSGDMFAPNSTTAYVSRIWNGTGAQNAAATGIGIANVDQYAKGEFLMRTGSSVTGDFAVTLASEIAASEVRIMVGSFLRYRKIPQLT